MSKIKFGTDGWRAIIGYDFTRDNLARITQATLNWLLSTHESPVVIIGYDCRFQGKLFAETCASVLASGGCKVFISPGFASTPMVSLATTRRQANAGIVITASHNPPEYSGFKVKGPFGGPAIPEDLVNIENRIEEMVPEYNSNFEDHVAAGRIEYYDMEALYLNHIRQSFDLKKIKESGIKIGYDAMYGAGQSVFKKILPDALMLHCDWNPSFEGTAPEPIERNLGPFQQFITENKIDVGLATDGDADRIGLFDSDARFVDSHHIILLLIHYLHKIKGMNGKVVTTFSCTDRIQKLCEKYQLPNQVTKVGFKYISEIMLNEEVLVGGEESGGIAAAGHIPERDGIYIGLLIIEYMAKTGKSLKQLVQELYKIVGPFSYGRRDLHLSEKEKIDIINEANSGKIIAFGDIKVNRTDDLDGFRFYLPDEQWVLVRPSGTEPVLRIYAESDTPEKVEKLLDKVIETLNPKVLN